MTKMTQKRYENMDGNVKEPETHEYLKLCQKHWHWILDNYDRLIEGFRTTWDLKSAYFNEYDLEGPVSMCYLCELTDTECLKCPLSGIAWRKDPNRPCVNDPDSVYLRIKYLMEHYRYKEAKDAIKEFLSIIDKECRQW